MAAACVDKDKKLGMSAAALFVYIDAAAACAAAMSAALSAASCSCCFVVVMIASWCSLDGGYPGSQQATLQAILYTPEVPPSPLPYPDAHSTPSGLNHKPNDLK